MPYQIGKQNPKHFNFSKIYCFDLTIDNSNGTLNQNYNVIKDCALLSQLISWRKRVKMGIKNRLNLKTKSSVIIKKSDRAIIQ